MWITGSPTDVSCTKKTTVIYLDFPSVLLHAIFQYFSLCPKHLAIAETHFVQLSVHFCQERGTVTVSRSYKVTLALGSRRNIEKISVQVKKKVSEVLSFCFLCAHCALRLSHSWLQTGPVPTAAQVIAWGHIENTGVISTTAGNLILLWVL